MVILITALAPFSSFSSHLIPHCVVKLLNLTDWLFSIKAAVNYEANRRTRYRFYSHSFFTGTCMLDTTHKLKANKKQILHNTVSKQRRIAEYNCFCKGFINGRRLRCLSFCKETLQEFAAS